MEFKLPPLIQNEKGEIRKVGFEIEFAETDLDSVAAAIQKLFGGEHLIENNFLHKVKGTIIGNFTVEMDAQVLTEKKYDVILEKLGLTDHKAIDKMVESAASYLVPVEVGTPPVPITELATLDRLRKELMDLKAKGTKTSILRAFGTHINPELPKVSVEIVLAYLRSFLLLYPWLFENSNIDISRRISTFIKPFPDNYINLVLQPQYFPDYDTFLSDYYKYNPDRNRPLDLYPVLAFLDKDKVFRLEGLGPVKSRPTFHYRLPNSLVDNPHWSLASEWNCWVEIEKLAADEGKMVELSKEYLKLNKDTLFGFDGKWISRTNEWIKC